MSKKARKKVLIFIPVFSKLTETFIKREVVELIKKNNLDITVFSLQKANVILDPCFNGKVVYQRINWLDVVISLKLFFSDFINNTKLLIEILNNPNRTFLNSFFLFFKSNAYALLFKKFEPNIIYAHFMSESSSLCLIASKILKTEFAVSAHAKDVLQTKGEQSENVELINIKAKYCKFITVCNSFAYKKLYESTDLKYKNKIHLYYHGIDYNQLKKDFSNSINQVQISKIKEQENFLTLFTIGRFIEKKGFTYLIEAVLALKKMGVNLKLFIAGAEGPLYQGIKDMIEINELNEQIIILGDGVGVDFSTILSYFKLADIFVFPSVNVGDYDADGIPNVLIESALLEVPIITTDAGSITEFLQNNKEAIIIKQKDSNQLVESILLISKDKKLREVLINNAKNKAMKMFDIKNNVNQIEMLLLS